MSAVTSVPSAEPRFPQTRDLPLFSQAVVAASAAADIGLRTAAASLVTSSLVRHAASPGRIRADFDRLSFYADLAAHKDTEVSFPAPTQMPKVERVRRSPVIGLDKNGHAELLRFKSPFVPLHPELRVRFDDLRRNQYAWAQHWRHESGPRPTLLVVHGFMASPHWLNSAFLSLPWFFSHGYDVLMVTLPHHGRRRRHPFTYNGSGLFADGLGLLAESMGQAVHDIRIWISHLLGQGASGVGLTGISLGGCLTGLLAETDDRISFAIPNVPVTDFAELMRTWVPAATLVQAGLRLFGRDHQHVVNAMDYISPLNYPARLDRDNLMVIAGLGDRLAPPEQAERLWQHWQQPALHTFRGNHILHIEQGNYLREMGRFLHRIGFPD